MSSMGPAVHLDDSPDDLTGDQAGGHGLALAPESVTVRRNAGLAAVAGGLASAVAIAWLARAAETGSPLDWALGAVLGLVGALHLVALVDARTPLLVADTQGVRIRLGRDWRGLPWGALSRVEHTPRRGPLRDGRLVMVVHNPARLLEELDRGSRRHTAWSTRLYGAPFALPLGLSTRVSGAGEDLTAALRSLAGDGSRVVEPEPAAVDAPVVEPVETAVVERVETTRAETTVVEPVETTRTETDSAVVEPGSAVVEPGSAVVEPGSAVVEPVETHPGLRPTVAHALFRLSGLFERRRGADLDAGAADDVPDSPDNSDSLEDEEALAASATPSPLRESVAASRVEVRRELAEAPADEPQGRELRRPGSVSLVEDTVVWGERVSPIARSGPAVEPLRVDDDAVEPAADPVVGPELAAARTRLGLSVDALAERTRIRPHVIESIEVDDFAPCGGDFYARGHLRTLARVLGADVAPLLATYEDRYADAPISPRRVFEAELATGATGSIRSTRGGPNWSVLVAAVMAVVLAWSVARLVMDGPADVQESLVLNGSAGVANGGAKAAPAVPVVLNAAGGGARVVVRDGAGTVVFTGNLAFGETRTLQVSPPVRVQTTDGSLTAVVDGQDHGALGATGQQAQDTFTVAR